MENNFENYVVNATRTESRVDDIDGRNSRVLHALMGLVTESGELIDAIKRHYFYVKEDKTRKSLDVVNLREECGDLMWYLAILCDHYDKDFQESYNQLVLADSPEEVSSIRLLRRSTLISLTANKMLNDFLILNADPNVEELFNYVNYLVYELNGSWKEISKKNIEKLQHRFPDKYNVDKAYNRDLGTEREILENDG